MSRFLGKIILALSICLLLGTAEASASWRIHYYGVPYAYYGVATPAYAPSTAYAGNPVFAPVSAPAYVAAPVYVPRPVYTPRPVYAPAPVYMPAPVYAPSPAYYYAPPQVHYYNPYYSPAVWPAY
jgi:hypothetical protein